MPEILVFRTSMPSKISSDSLIPSSVAVPRSQHRPGRRAEDAKVGEGSWSFRNAPANAKSASSFITDQEGFAVFPFTGDSKGLFSFSAAHTASGQLVPFHTDVLEPDLYRQFDQTEKRAALDTIWINFWGAGQVQDLGRIKSLLCEHWIVSISLGSSFQT